MMLLSEARISSSSLLHNLAFLRAAGGGKPTICVVKANAYGHGVALVAPVLAPHTEWFAVAQIQEAIELRNLGITHPILVFAPPQSASAFLYREHHITAVVSAIDHFKRLLPGTGIHLHFDTGMRRTGLYPEQMAEVEAALARHASLDYTGLMTHFASADDHIGMSYQAQLDVFEPVMERLGREVMVHAANSATLMMREDARFDAIRPGISLFGIDPAPTQRNGLIPSLTWDSFLIQVKSIRKGDRVSYGGTWEAPSDGFYGVVPVGYNDGLMRPLSGKISFGLPDREVSQIGTITMDACMVWLGEEPAQVGTPVSIYDADAYRLRKWSILMQTISYELLCAIGARVNRKLT
jgi:alanine racemase